MKKKILSMAIALSIAAAFMPTLASAETEEKYGEYLYYEVEKYAGGDSFVMITGCDHKATEIEIPSKIDGMPVTHICAEAFACCENLQSVTIPDSVTIINDEAFAYCENLQSITIPKGVTYIGAGAFDGCSSLQSVTIPNSVTDIGIYAFANCSSLQSVTISRRLTSIEQSVFAYCESLQSITIPSSVESINSYAFEGCSSLQSINVDEANIDYCSVDGVLFDKDKILLVKYPQGKKDTSYTISDSVTDIDSCAFMDCSSLQSVIIPDSVTSIGGDAFYDCSSLKSINVDEGNKDYCSVDGVLFDKGKTVLIIYPCRKKDISYTVPDSVTEIDYSAFYGCSSLQSVIIPDSVTYIGYHAFEGCSSLQSITIPNGVTDISAYVFEGCSSLQSVTIPNSVTEIGYFAFANCSSLQSIIIPDSVIMINDDAFAYCENLQSVTIPNSVTEIGYHAFYGCSSLQSITIPSSVESIDNYAFKGCSSLQSINVDEGNEYYCSADGVLFAMDKIGLVQYPQGKKDISYTIPDSVKWIDYDAFNSCENLQSITIPNSVTHIYADMFNGCSSLQSINVDEGNKDYCSVDGVLFNKDKTVLIIYPRGKKDISYTIPDSVTDIGDEAFYGCSSLQSITIPDSVTSIGRDTFYGCSSLQSIIIPDNVRGIDRSTFLGCKSLQSIIIPNSVTYIRIEAFYGCSSLQSITIPDSVIMINDDAFGDCDNLKDVYYAGTEAMWNNIDMGKENDCLLNATIHYNYIGTTPDVYEIGAVTPTETGVEFTVTTNENVSGTQAVMVACYDENGAFIGLKQEEITASDETQTIEVDIDKANAESVKVFIWNRLEYMMPASNAQSLELE